jgi:hypothetical protein
MNSSLNDSKAMLTTPVEIVCGEQYTNVCNPTAERITGHDLSLSILAEISMSPGSQVLEGPSGHL